MTHAWLEEIRTAMSTAGWLTAPPTDDRPTRHPGEPGAYVGIDLGGTKIATGLVLTGDRTVVVESRELTDPRGGLALVAQLADAVGALVDRAAATGSMAPPEVRGIALGCPGVLDPDSGAVHQAPNLPGWDAIDVRTALTEAFGRPVVIDNDVNLAAWGEHRWLDTPDLAFLALGTGIGLGTVLGGAVRRGAHGEAGEICHLPLGGDPFDRDLQRHGVLEATLSGAGIVALHQDAGGVQATVPDIFAAAGAGDPTAISTVHATARMLALAARTVAAVIDPGQIILGGGIGARPELLGPTRQALAATGGSPIAVRTSAFGHRATVAGALAAAIDSALTTGGK